MGHPNPPRITKCPYLFPQVSAIITCPFLSMPINECAFDATFNKDRFQKQHRNYFSSLRLSKLAKTSVEDEFISYEVNTSSEISSPKSFYNFLDAVNKSDWIIAVEFPINFKRDSEMIKSSFTMKVYGVNKDANTTTKVVE